MTRPKTLRVGVSSPPPSRLAVTNMDGTSSLLLGQVVETPFAPGHDGHEPEPILFDAPLRRQGAAVVGSLRPEQRFSDGSVLTAHDVAQCLGRAAALDQLRFRALDECDLCIERPESGQSDPRAIERLLSHRRAAVWKEGPTLDRPLGTGPFALTELTSDNAVLEPNEHHRRPITLARLEIVVYRDSELALALGSGQIDLTLDLSREEAQRISGVRKLFAPGDSTAILFLNTQSPLLAEAATRTALARAIDRHDVAALSYDNPVAYTAKGVLPPAIGRHAHGRIRSPHDPDSAREYFAGRPFDRPLNMTRVWGPRAYLPQPQETALAIERQLASVGVAIRHQATRDVDHYFEYLLSGDYDLLLGGWVADTPDASDFLEAILASKMIPTRATLANASCNLARWADETTDELLARHRAGDPDAMALLEETITTARPLIPLMHGPSVAVHGWHIQGFQWTSRYSPDFTRIELDDAGG